MYTEFKVGSHNMITYNPDSHLSLDISNSNPDTPVCLSTVSNLDRLVTSLVWPVMTRNFGLIVKANWILPHLFALQQMTAEFIKIVQYPFGTSLDYIINFDLYTWKIWDL